VTDPVDELFGASFTRFVEERKRLVAALKADGQKLPAQRLAAINRPPISAWAVNQLWRQAREEMDALFEAARRVRGGDLEATGMYREVLADLKARAAEVLKADGNGVSEAVLRRISQTLQALAAAGGFEPDPAGQLKGDRDPPGFESLAGAVLVAPAGKTKSRRDTVVEVREEEAETVVEEGDGDGEEDEEGDGEEEEEGEEEELEQTVAEDVEEIDDDEIEDDEDAAETRAALAAEARAQKRAELEAAVAAAQRIEATAKRDLAAAQTLLAAAQDRVTRAEAAANAARVKAERLSAELGELDDVVD
jgi:hypothetical protein